MAPKRYYLLLTPSISAVAVSTLTAFAMRPSLVDRREVFDGYNTNMTTYEGDGTQCVNAAL